MRKRLLGIVSLVILGSTMSLVANAAEISATSTGNGYESMKHDGIDLGNGMSLDGYFRMGKQYSSETGNEGLKTDSWKTGRLANEGNSWNLDFHWRAMNSNGTWIKVMSTIERRENAVEPKDGRLDTSDLVMSTAFATVGGFVKSMPDMAVWGGKRSVGEWHNSWLIDADLPSYSGTGAGVENVDVIGGGKFEAAYINMDKQYWWTTGYGNNVNEGYSHLIYLGYKPIKNLSFQLAANRYSEDDTLNIKKQGFARKGIQATIAYDFDKYLGFLPGNSTALIQYSTKSMTVGGSPWGSEKDKSLMGTFYGNTKIAKLPLSTQIYYKTADDYEGKEVISSKRVDTKEFGSTVRVFIPVVENFMVQTELGYGFIDRKKEGTEFATEKHMKIAVAPTLVVGSMYNVTPEFRVIGAYQKLDNKGGSKDPKADYKEWTVGAQVELSF